MARGLRFLVSATGLTAALFAAGAPANAHIFEIAPGLMDVPPGLDGNCTLREAIIAANTNTAANNCAAGDPTATAVDEILLAAGDYNLGWGAYHEDNAQGGDLDVREDLKIVGAGSASTTIDARGADAGTMPAVDRVFDVFSPATVSMSGVTITGGQGYDSGLGGVSGDDGGAIRDAGVLTLTGVVVTGNHAGNGGNGNPGQGGGTGGSGGGIYVSPDASLVVTNSTISNNASGAGGAPGSVNAGTGPSGGSGGDGGGIATSISASALTITNSTISGNHAGSGGAGVATTNSSGQPGGTGGSGGSGGGVFSYGSILNISGSTISGNSTGSGAVGGTSTNTLGGPGGYGGHGGGVYAVASFTITTSVIANNTTGSGAAAGTGPTTSLAGGGGIGGGFATTGSGSIASSTVSGNTTGAGGAFPNPGQGGRGAGVAALLGTVTLDRLTISGNATGPGGNGNGHGGDGGGLYAESATVTVTNSTIAGNQAGPAGTGGGVPAGGIGGGAFHSGGTTALRHVTIASNRVANDGSGAGIGTTGNGLTLTNSIVASNQLLSGSAANCSSSGSAIADGGHNVSFGDATCPGVNGDPLLAALADNGGPTRTITLGEGSSAIDIVPTSGADCAATDQRGVARPQRSACDAGAFEAEPVPPQPTDGGGDGGGGGAPGGGTTALQPGGTAAADTTAPRVRLLLAAQRLLRALKKGYAVAFDTNEPGSAVAALFAEGKTARGAAVKRKRVARGALRFTTAGKKRVVAKFTKRAGRAFAKRRRVRLLLVLTVKDASGNTTTLRRRVTLKR